MILPVALQQFVSRDGLVMLRNLLFAHNESHKVQLPRIHHILYLLFVVIGHEWCVEDHAVFPFVVDGHQDVIVHLNNHTCTLKDSLMSLEL